MSLSESNVFITWQSAVSAQLPPSCLCGVQQPDAAWVRVYHPLQVERHVQGVEGSQAGDAHNQCQHPEICPAPKVTIRLTWFKTPTADGKTNRDVATEMTILWWVDVQQLDSWLQLQASLVVENNTLIESSARLKKSNFAAARGAKLHSGTYTKRSD